MNFHLKLYLASRILSQAGASALSLALGIWVRKLTGSNTLAGLTVALVVAPQVFGLLLGGYLDSIPRKGGIVVADLLSCLALSALLVETLRSTIWAVWAVGVIVGLLGVVVSASSAGALKLLASDDEVNRAVAILNGAGGMLAVISPLGGAALLAAGGVSAFAVTAAGLLAAACLVLIPCKIPVGAEVRTGGISAGLRFVWSVPTLRVVVLSLGLAQCVAGSIDGALYAFIESLGRSPSFVGVLVSAQGCGMVVGALATTMLLKRLRPAKGVALGLFGVSLCLLALCLVFQRSALAALFVALAGYFAAMLFTCSGVLLQLTTPEHLIGRVQGSVNAVQGVPAAASIALGAILVGFISFRWVYLFSAVACAFSGYLILRTARRQAFG